MDFNSHPLQSAEWANFRKQTGVRVIKGKGGFLTIHSVPHTKYAIGYLPKSFIPKKETLEELTEIGKKEKCIFIQLEPNVVKNKETESKVNELSQDFPMKKAAHPLFTKYSFVLNLTLPEDELLKNMHPKTRYNIKLADKQGVTIIEDNSDKAFEEYLKLTSETTKRQGFYAHSKNYHQTLWKTLKKNNNLSRDKLNACLFLAKYKDRVLAAWILFTYKDALYYPYGSSSLEHREVMASNLIMWEAIKYGKRLGLKKFDMWGSLGPNASPKDPWFGFHKFKQGYGAELIEFLGSYDLIIKPNVYRLYKIADKVRWNLLKIKQKFQ